MRRVPSTPLGPFDLFARASTGNPGAVAVDDGGTSVLYSQALQSSRRLAWHLRERGVRRGDIVGIDLPPALHAIFALAVLHEAAASVALRPVPAQPAHRLDWVISARAESRVDAHRHILVDSVLLETLNSPAPGFAPVPFASPDDLCRMAYSSGTTGTPKAVPLSLAAVMSRSQAARDLMIPAESFLCTLDIGSASGFHTFIAAVTTGTTYLVPGTSSQNAALVLRHRVAALKASPVQLSQLCDELTRLGTRAPFLRTAYVAGSVTPPAVQAKLRDRTGATLVSLYGSTEAGRAAQGVVSDRDLNAVGRAARGAVLQVVDDEDRPVPPGRIGRVRYRREHQATEYAGDPAATARSFRDGWFYPGDLGTLDASGSLRLAGRVSDLINASGVKIDPSESESVVLTSGLVDDAAGFAFTDTDGLTRFALAVVSARTVDWAEVNRALSVALGPRAPSALFKVPQVPRTESGKVLRSELRRLYETRVVQRLPQSPSS